MRLLPIRILLMAAAAIVTACATDRPIQDTTTMLEMKPACLRCEAPTPHDADAYICSFECTFCEACTLEMKHVCPNCGGELLPRPKRH